MYERDDVMLYQTKSRKDRIEVSCGDNEAPVRRTETMMRKEGGGPMFTWIEVNPTLHRLVVDGVAGMCTVRLRERYHKGWRGQVVSRIGGNAERRTVMEHERDERNGYGNVWRTAEVVRDKSGDGTRRLEVELKYVPQVWFERGSLISILGVLMLGGAVIRERRRMSKHAR